MRNRKLDRSREERKEKKKKKKKNLEEGRMTVSESGETKKKKKKKIPSSRLWKANQNRLETHQIVSD